MGLVFKSPITVSSTSLGLKEQKISILKKQLDELIIPEDTSDDLKKVEVDISCNLELISKNTQAELLSKQHAA